MSSKHPNKAPNQKWRTPVALFRELERRYARGEFTIDVAADVTNHLCRLYLDEEDDALSDATPWGTVEAPSRVFINPPFNNITPWVKKAHAEVHAGRCEVVVMLVPGRVETPWYHFARANGRVHEVFGRVQFIPEPGTPRSSNTEGSVVVVFDQPLVAAAYKATRAELGREVRAA